MKNLLLSLLVLASFSIWMTSCGGGQSKIDEIKANSIKTPADPMADWQSNHGVGPIKAFELPESVDQALVTTGQGVYNAKCTACHKIDKKFIGPSPKGILSRRTPAWTMNMILNPEEMVQKDPIAKQLLIDANGSPMANQSLTQEEARAILEYFRTL